LFSFTVPYIFRRIFLSNTANTLSSSMVSVHDSEPLVTTGRINVRYICNLLLLKIEYYLVYKNNCDFPTIFAVITAYIFMLSEQRIQTRNRDGRGSN
jgi:hypothetical protein